MSRLRGLLWLTTGIIVAMVAGLVGYNTLNRAVVAPTGQQAAAPTEKVVVASRPVVRRTLLSIEDVVLKDLPIDAIPPGAASSIDDAVGQLVLADLYEGEIVVLSRLLKPNVLPDNNNIAFALTDEEILLAVPAQDFLSRLNLLKPGDQVDVLFSLDFPESRSTTSDGNTNDDERQATFHTLQNVTIAGMTGAQRSGSEADTTNPAPSGLLLALAPQDAMTLKFAMDAGGILDFVLRAPGAEQPFSTQPVDIDYMIQKYDIPIGAGK